MKPKKPERSEAEDLFRAGLQNIIAPKHPLVRLAHETDWGFFEAAIEPLYAERGRPGVPVRFMVGLHILKHTFNLSDEEVCERWVENPYFQYFTGEEYFCHDSTDFVFAKIQRSERRQSAPGRIAGVEALRSEHGSLVGSIEYAGAHPLGQ